MILVCNLTGELENFWVLLSDFYVRPGTEQDCFLCRILPAQFCYRMDYFFYIHIITACFYFIPAQDRDEANRSILH